MTNFFGKDVINLSKATKLKEMESSFDVFALEGENFNDYYVEVSNARGIDVSKKMVYRFNEVTYDNNRKVLFLGHYGCGKTTELYKICQQLKEKYVIVKYSIVEETDIVNFNYIDFIFTILNNIFTVAKKESIKIPNDILDSLYNYWYDEKIVEICDESSAKCEATLEMKASWLAMITAKVKGVLQTGSETKSVIRKKIEPSLKVLLADINNLIKSINNEISPKKLLLVVEDLDKLEIEQAQDLFVQHRKTITSIKIDSIYTFPIFLYYSEFYNEILNDFNADELLSIIKVREKDGKPFDAGINVIKEIVWKRCDKNLIEEKALEFLIEKSGGSFRDLFTMISNAALLADIDEKDSIDVPNAMLAYQTLKSRRERAIKKHHIPLLKEVYDDKTKKPVGDDDNFLIELLHSMSLIEYNGERWCDLHPAIKDYLTEKGEI